MTTSNNLGEEQAPLRQFSSVQFSSVAQSCPTLCDPMNRSTPGLPVHHQLPEFTQTHVHRVGDANSMEELTFLNCGVGENSLDCKEVQPVHPEGDQS